MARISSISKKATKPRKPRLSRSAQMTIDEKYMGPEPFFSEEPSRVEMGNAFTWFNYFYTGKDFKPVVLDWLEEKGICDKERVRKLKRVPDYKFNSTIGTIAHLDSKGSKLLEGSLNWVNKWLPEVESMAGGMKDPEPDVKKTKKVEPKKLTIQDRMKKKADEVLFELDDHIDNQKIDMYAFLQKKQLTAPIVKLIIEGLRPEGEEMIEAAAGTCEQLNEGYSHLPKKQLNSIAKFWKGVLSDAERYYDNLIATRVKKPRKKRSAPIEKQVSKVKYLKQDTDLKIVSIPPHNMIGKMHVILFNTKYKQLSILTCNTRDGFTVKGTTLQNVFEEQSWSKRLRKPEDVISKVLSGTPRQLDNVNKAIKTKPLPVNGRLNDNTIILRAF